MHVIYGNRCWDLLFVVQTIGKIMKMSCLNYGILNLTFDFATTAWRKLDCVHAYAG